MNDHAIALTWPCDVYRDLIYCSIKYLWPDCNVNYGIIRWEGRRKRESNGKIHRTKYCDWISAIIITEPLCWWAKRIDFFSDEVKLKNSSEYHFFGNLPKKGDKFLDFELLAVLYFRMRRHLELSPNSHNFFLRETVEISSLGRRNFPTFSNFFNLKNCQQHLQESSGMQFISKIIGHNIHL